MKKPTGSRFLLKKQLVKVLYEAIPRLETPEQADELECSIVSAHRGGILSDKDYYQLTKMLSEVRSSHGWEVVSV